MAWTPMAHILRQFEPVFVFFSPVLWRLYDSLDNSGLLYYFDVYVVCAHMNRLAEAILVNTHDILLFWKNRRDEHIMLLELVLWSTLVVASCSCLGRIFIVPKAMKAFEPLKNDCICLCYCFVPFLLLGINCLRDKFLQTQIRLRGAVWSESSFFHVTVHDTL